MASLTQTEDVFNHADKERLLMVFRDHVEDAPYRAKHAVLKEIV